MSSTSTREIKAVPAFPWLGIDIGGTLVKLVYFELLDLTEDEIRTEGEILMNIRHYLTSNRAYGQDGVRDHGLELTNIQLGGRRGNLHFIRFPTSRMPNFIDLCSMRNLHTLTFEIYATGGGAYKFEKDIVEKLKINWCKCDELDTLIQGLSYLSKLNSKECFYFEEPQNDANPNKNPFTFDTKQPFLLVNIGSGISILHVDSNRNYRRITGTSIGGGTFLGLCCLLTGCSSYDEAIKLATEGDSTKIDKLVRDIYGGDYERFGLPDQELNNSDLHQRLQRSLNNSLFDNKTLNDTGNNNNLQLDTENAQKSINITSISLLNEINISNNQSQLAGDNNNNLLKRDAVENAGEEKVIIG
ncbi:unnamed protein product [Rotaria magnacalcarata]|uniref:Pantothenate kinase n=1 Tax=Rotaria magnacalcarata TaxID=392030 RepID=A0A819NEC2_9BILA|nr:unnamed protein product [Rotaria magnacalcarata]